MRRRASPDVTGRNRRRLWQPAVLEGSGRLRQAVRCCGAMPGWAHADMMHTMSEGNSVDPAAGDRQPDLFDDHGRAEGEFAPPPSVLPAGPPPAELTDGELIAMLPQAGRSNVEALSAEVVSRSLAEAVPALETPWDRFSGFGVKVPYPEQRAVLSTLARLECEAGRRAGAPGACARVLARSAAPSCSCARSRVRRPASRGSAWR